MKRQNLIGAFASVAIVFGLAGLSSQEAEAACIKNETGRTLYVMMTSKAGKLAQNLITGTQVCQKISQNTDVVVNILPYGGARFGCRKEMKGGDTAILRRFHTMNKCAFD